MAPCRVRAFSIETNEITLPMNQATQLYQSKQSISMAKIHNSTNKSSKYACINQRNLNAITIAAIHNEDGWGVMRSLPSVRQNWATQVIPRTLNE